jgi:FkbM family methyltransferase
MTLTTFVDNGSRLFGIKFRRTVSSFGNALAVYGIEKKDFTLNGDDINFKRLNISLKKEKALPLLQGYNDAIKLLNRGGVEFLVDADGYPNIRIDNLQFKINDEEELFILYEVFLEGTYNLISTTNKQITLIDIGMNVGITSLFYAAQPKVDQVISFEPFLPTYKMAAHNMALNPGVSGKITANNFGLAEAAGTLLVPYSLSQKGRMGLSGLPKKSNKIMEVRKEEIFLKPVNDQFNGLKHKAGGNFIVCKIDCEGAEYEIIDSLADAKLLDMPDVYFIEWHHKSPENMLRKLVEAKFNVISTTYKNLNTGMIYAVKNAEGINTKEGFITN